MATLGRVLGPRLSARILRRFPLRELGTALPALLIMWAVLHYYGVFVSDDAFISFRYAEHLATGQGLQWNPGYRVEGYTNFLWVVLIALLHLLGLAEPQGARFLAWLVCSLSVVLVVLAARRETSRPSWFLLVLAPLPLVLTFPYQYWSSMLLETPLFGMLLLLSVLLFVQEEERHAGPRWPSALAYLALALTRPEGTMFLVVPGIYLLSRIRSRAQLERVLRERWLWLALLLGGLLCYHLWRVLYFGDLFPNTYYAKIGGEDVLERGWIYLTRSLNGRPYLLVLFALSLVLGGAQFRAGALMLGTLLTLAAVVVIEGGDWMREWRLVVPGLPLLAACLALSIQRLMAELSRTARLLPLAGMALLCLGVQGNQGTPPDEMKQALAGGRRDMLINLEGEMIRAGAEVGIWLRAHSRPTDLIAVNHAGAIPYFSKRPTIDMVGLNDRHIARLSGPRHSKWDPEYVLGRRPLFVVLNSRSMPFPPKTFVADYWGGETALYAHPEFKRNYRMVRKVWSWRHRSLEYRDWPGHSTSYMAVFKRVPRLRRRVGACLDFESGTFKGWEVEGAAFGKKPSVGPRGPQNVKGFLGRYLANSYPGTDSAAGLLRSLPFVIQGRFMEFLVGGGANRAQVGVQLKVGGQVVRQASGRNSGRLRLAEWDLSPYRGQRAVLEIYDRGPGYWCHVLADDFCQFDPVQPKRTGPGKASGARKD